MTTSPTSLTFTTGNWGTAQTVTVNGAEDADGIDDTATLRMTAAGGGYNDVAHKDVVVTVSDNDTPGYTFDPTSLTITEGSSDTFTVKLNIQPSDSVTVTLRQPADNTDLTVDTDTGEDGNQNTLTFTTTNWKTAQTVTVSAKEDDDGTQDTATISVSATGGNYASLTASVGVTVTENDTLGLTVSKSALTVSENSTGTFTVKLDTEPSASVTVNITQPTGSNADVTTTPTSLTFTTTNWGTEQTVTVNVAEDGDGIDDSATLRVKATGGGYDSVAPEKVEVTVDDNDTLGMTVSVTSLTVNENSNDTFTVKLDTQPGGNVTVSIAQTGANNSDVTVDNASLIFTTTNWGTEQTVTVNAAEDNDGIDDSATLRVSATGGGYGNVASKDVSVTVRDNDEIGLTLVPRSMNVDEGGSAPFTVALTSRPSGDVSVRLDRPTNADVTVDKTSLTFTSANWNTAQTVMVSAKEDDDNQDDNATISLTASGSGYDTQASVSVTVADDEKTGPGDGDPALVISKNPVAITEGASSAFTVRPATQPSANVTVSLTQGVVGAANPDVSFTPATLTFTTQDWATAQTVTVFAAEDDDEIDDRATISLNAAGEGYDGVTDSVEIEITDLGDRPLPGTPSLVIMGDPVILNEGETKAFAVGLSVQPRSDVIVSLGQPSNEDVTVDTDPGAPGNQTSLVFTVSNWSTSQAVFVFAARDDDTANESVRVSLSASGGGYTGVSAKVAVGVNDLTVTPKPPAPTGPEPTAPPKPPVDPEEPEEPEEPNPPDPEDPEPVAGAGLTFEGVPLEVEEGSDRRLRVRLSARPRDEVNLVVGGSDNSDITATPSALTFGPSDWGAMQEIVIFAAEDDDALDERAVIAVSTSGGGYEGVEEDLSVSIIDDDEAALVLMEVPSEMREGGRDSFQMKLATRPSGNVEIALVEGDDKTLSISSVRQVGIGNDGNDGDDKAGSSESSSTEFPRVVFTPENWGRAQEVALVASQDDDGVDEESRLYLSASGGDYDGVREQLSITIKDDDIRSLILDGTPLELAEGESGYFRVKLATRPTSAVTLAVDVSIGGADIEVDADASSQGRQSTMVIEPAHWNEMREVSVQALRDADEDDERAEIVLQASGGDYEGVRSGVGVRVDDVGNGGSAWLTRFARAVCLQAVEGIEGRLDRGRSGRGVSDLSAQVGGREIAGRGDVSAAIRVRDETEGDPEDGFDDFEREESMTLSEMLSNGTSFNITRGISNSAGVSLWGEIQSSGYEGQTAGSAVDGEVSTGMLGVDYAAQGWVLGVVGMYSEAKGDIREEGASTEKEADLTTMIPWAAMDLDSGLRLRGALGYGSGQLRANRSDSAQSEGSLDWKMMNAGVRKELIESPEGGGFGLGLTTDFLWTNIRSDAIGEWAEIEGEARRIRAGIEGSFAQRSEAGGRFSQKIDAGLRHDSGDAEEGWGVDIGAGLAYGDSEAGLELSLKGRMLVYHREEAARDWGVSAGVEWDGSPGTSRGLSVRIHNDLGGVEPAGGVDALFSDAAFPSLAIGEDQGMRWRAEVAYGMRVGKRGLVGSPYLEHVRSSSERQNRLGYRVDDEKHGGLSMDIYLMSRESEDGQGESDLSVKGTVRYDIRP
ncbi:MAG: hypothetical protein ISN28_07055 [Ectothiorhodospiraceae bacterium AqS1]|nr:hypothetical protein [Ectothiorhodospiraceae bacterium AqS1]